LALHAGDPLGRGSNHADQVVSPRDGLWT
jgi:hypothetical protein